ncbi:MAG: YgaP family membrane protein [Flavobacteriaceae bacterium]
MNSLDRSLRLFVAAVLTILYFTNILTGLVGTILLVVAGVFTLTSLVGFCPLYRLLRIKSGA